MANNQCIQILRTDPDKDTTSENTVLGDGNKNKQVLEGQPILDTSNNWLYVATATNTIENQKSRSNNMEGTTFETIHPNYNERCLTDDEVAAIWANTATSAEGE